MDLTYIGYLLFVIPGFCLVWAYRHFTEAGEIGEFEYAGWSFLWGTFLFLLATEILKNGGISIPPTSLSEPISLAAAFLGIGLTIAIALAFPAGYLGALIAHSGFFKVIDKRLFWVIRKFGDTVKERTRK